MKKFMAIMLAAVLVFSLTGCIKVVLDDNTKAEDTASTAAPETTGAEDETTAPETTEEKATEPEEEEIILEPGLFEGEYTSTTYNNKGDSSLNLQADARFFSETYWSDGGGGNNVMGNYVVKGRKLYTYTWFVQAGDPSAEAAPDLYSVYEIVDENTLSLISETATATYKRVTDQAKVDAFTAANSIVAKLTRYELVNEHGTPSVKTENPAKAVSVYEYHVTEGFLRDVELTLFENGRFYLFSFYDDGSAGSLVLGNYYFKDGCFWLLPWFTGGGDPSLTLCNGSADRYMVAQNGSLLTSAFQGSTDGLDIILKLNENADLDAATTGNDIVAALKYSILYNH